MKILSIFLDFALHLFLAASLVFFLIRLAPGDPIEKLLGPEATVEEIEKKREELGLSRSLMQQYQDFLVATIQFDLGESYASQKEVSSLLMQHLKPTSIIAIVSIALIFVVGCFWGLLVCFFRKSLWETIFKTTSLLFISIPIFSLAPLLIIIFALELHLLPVSEWENWRNAVLPCLTLILPLSAVVSRFVRTRFLDEHNEMWITVLRAKGLSETGVTLRLLKAILPTVLTILTIQFAVILTGTIITETIFDIPGLGQLLFESINGRDYPVVQGVILYSTLAFLILFKISDHINRILDPRTRA